jgi:hypothetical protein
MADVASGAGERDTRVQASMLLRPLRQAALDTSTHCKRVVAVGSSVAHAAFTCPPCHQTPVDGVSGASERSGSGPTSDTCCFVRAGNAL